MKEEKMAEEKDDSINSPQDEEKETVEEIIIEEIEEVITDLPAEEKQDEESEKGEVQIKKQKNMINFILIAVLVIAVAALAIIDYPKISNFIKNQRNPYGFDYNFNKVKDYDWDTMITEKKVAKALNVPIDKINSAKNPDYSWVLEDPDQFVNQVKCASLIDEKILNEANADSKNLFNITVMLCNNTQETNNTFNSRKDEINNVEKTDATIKIQKIEDTKNIGDKGYTYLISKEAAAADPSNPSANQAPAQKFGGIVFVRGPFMVMIDESEQQGMATLSSDEVRNKLSNYIDRELKRILAWY